VLARLRTILLRGIPAVLAVATAGMDASAGAATSSSPVGWAMVSSGDYANCGVGFDGTLWCWGANRWGVLGLGDRRSRSEPTQVGDATTWESVSLGPSHTCAIQSDESLWCWGSNHYGELGIGQRSSGPIVPTQVTKGGHGGWLEVTTGAHYTCAVDRTHRYWCWGFDVDGQFGDGSSGHHRTRPELVGTDQEWSSLSASPYDAHTCGTTLDGSLFCWGINHDGQLGIGSTKRHTRPTRVGRDSNWAGVAVGGPYTCATKTDATLWCWGSAEDGELGTGATEDQLSPQQVEPALSWASVTVGWNHTCATGSDGTAWCWGSNTDGELGDGTTVGHPTPVQVAGSGWQRLSAGIAHTCGVQVDQTLWCWGSYGTDSGSLVPVQIA
jgi:alpha-tubulin suppressor-like RCC1 family protein